MSIEETVDSPWNIIKLTCFPLLWKEFISLSNLPCYHTTTSIISFRKRNHRNNRWHWNRNENTEKQWLRTPKKLQIMALNNSHNSQSNILQTCTTLSLHKDTFFPRSLEQDQYLEKLGNSISYRSTSLLNTPSKIFEKLILLQINKFLNYHNVLNLDQFGFWKLHSTTQ